MSEPIVIEVDHESNAIGALTHHPVDKPPNLNIIL